MPQLTYWEYQELAQKLNSRIGSGKARQKLIEYTRNNPLQAIEYMLKTLEKQQNKKLLELTTTTILETILNIPYHTAQELSLIHI